MSRGSGRIAAIVLVVAALGAACTGERPDVGGSAWQSGGAVRANDNQTPDRDPTGLSAGDTELSAPELLSFSEPAATVTSSDAELVEGGTGPVVPRATDPPDPGDNGPTSPDGSPPPTATPFGPLTESDVPPEELAYPASGDLDRVSGYDDPWPTILAATGRGIDPATTDRTAGITNTTIRVGGVVAQTVSTSLHLQGACEGAAARLAGANERAELSRTIEVAECLDDASQTDVSVGMVNALARNDIAAVVPLLTPAYVDPTPLQAAGMPFFGWGGTAAFCSRTSSFGASIEGAADCPVLDTRGYTVVSTPVLTALTSSTSLSRPSYVLVVEDSARGTQRADARTLEAELLGLPEPAIIRVPPASQPRPSSWRLTAGAVIDASPDLVVIDTDAFTGLITALRSAGFDGEIAYVGHVDPRDLDTAADALASEKEPDAPIAELDGVLVVSPAIDLAATSSQAWARIEADAALVEYAADDIGLAFVQGYLAADMFVQLVADTPEPLTGDALHRTLNDGWWYPGLGNVACGSWWPASHLIETPCVSLARVDLSTGSLVPLLGLRETRPQLEFRLAE